jgi:hypothetical protein
MKKMNKTAIIFDEPELEFRYGQKVKDPHDGLSLFGPFDADDKSSNPGTISYVIIGTRHDIETFKTWAKLMNQACTDAPRNNNRLWPVFPGYEAAFGIPWPDKAVAEYEIDDKKLSDAANYREQHERAYKVVDLYLEQIKIAKKRDEKISLAICIATDEVWLNCRPKSHVAHPVGEKMSRGRLVHRKTGQFELFTPFNPDQYSLSPDFRRQLKARAMEYELPVQIIRESTLRPNDSYERGERILTPLSDRMWNLSTALYYKAGGKPWRLVTAREGVCYIGLAFRLTGKGNTACCAAQMFLNTGDGIVFLGEYGPWYSADTNQFHLTPDAANNLLKGVLDTYRSQGGKELTEIFLHSRSTISAKEFEGYKKACPKGVKVVGVKVRPLRYGAQLFRMGNMPIIRGTFWELNEKNGLLWGSGFKPRLATYNGSEVPTPLHIEIEHGEASIERVAQDIFGLTKLNYNACRLGDSQPVTVGFSDAVGEILIANPTVKSRKPNFKYYI